MAINEKMRVMQHLNNAEKKAVKHHSKITKAFVFGDGSLTGRHDLIHALTGESWHKAKEAAQQIEDLMWKEKRGPKNDF